MKRLGLCAVALTLATGCATRPSVQPSQIEVGPALVMVLDGLAHAQQHQVARQRDASLVVTEASVNLSLTVKEGDKQSLVIAMPGVAGSPGFSLTPFDRARENTAVHSITVKLGGLINSPLKDSLLEGVKEAVRVKDGEPPERAVERLRKALEALQGVTPAVNAPR